MKKRLLYIYLLVPILTFAQANFNISGTITDTNGNPMGLVNITFNKNNKYDVSDDKGGYEIRKVNKGEYIITISSMGFEVITKKIIVDKNLQLNFTLKEESENLDDVIIKAKKQSTKQKEQAISIGSFELADVVANTAIITDQIDKISGVRIRRSGSLGDDSDISINGLNGSAIRTYVDGIPLEFLYPGLDLASIPLTSIKRVDVYKGVIPVDIGTDALGGGINIVSNDKKRNHVKASYSAGSFNTHLGDVNLTLVDDKDNFFNIAGGINYSDNDYTFKADVLVENPFAGPGAPPIEVEDQNIRRFHDQYRLQHTSTTIGTSNKKWTDKAQISLNYLNTFREIQNGATITNIAIGEAYLESENVSAILKYDKTILKDKLKLKTISNYSNGQLRFVDTTANAYNWLGDIFTRNGQGEFSEGDPALTEGETNSYVNRNTLSYTINDTNKVLLSNIIANQGIDITNFNVDNIELFDVEPTQKITKNILGLQYNSEYFEDKLKIGATVKYYSFNAKVLDDRSEQVLGLNDNFFGWNGSIKYKVTPGLAIRGSYERGFLIPEIFQFAGNGTTIRGNATIKPEESDNYNAGFLYANDFDEDYSISLSVSVFLRKQKNIIFLDIGNTPSQYVNAENVDSKGYEAEFKFKFLKGFNWITNVSYVDKEFVSFLNGGVQNDFLIGSPFPNTPKFFYNTKLNWNKKNIFNSKIGLSIYGAYSHVDAFNVIIVGAEQTLENSPESFVPDNNRLDAGFSLQFLNKKITTAFNVGNITNEELFDNFSIPRPGRNFNFKLIYELSNF